MLVSKGDSLNTIAIAVVRKRTPRETISTSFELDFFLATRWMRNPDARPIARADCERDPDLGKRVKNKADAGLGVPNVSPAKHAGNHRECDSEQDDRACVIERNHSVQVIDELALSPEALDDRHRRGRSSS
jgi:hypothetical protein